MEEFIISLPAVLVEQIQRSHRGNTRRTTSVDNQAASIFGCVVNGNEGSLAFLIDKVASLSLFKVGSLIVLFWLTVLAIDELSHEVGIVTIALLRWSWLGAL